MLTFQVFQSGDPKADEIFLTNMAVALNRIFMVVKVLVDSPIESSHSVVKVYGSSPMLLQNLSESNNSFAGPFCLLTVSQGHSRTFWLLQVWSEVYPSFDWLQVSQQHICFFSLCFIEFFIFLKDKRRRFYWWIV